MEERQTQIREGAGLEESRLNTEFIDWMQRYSAPLLVVIALVAGGYAGWNYLQRQREQGQDLAFVDLQSASASRSPVALVRVAEEHSSRGAVPALARLNAADLHLEAFRTGVKAGLQLRPDGSLPEGEKFLTDEERSAELTAASDLYKQVIADTERTPSAAMHTIGAWSGLASIAECLGKSDDARAHYQKVIAAAKAAGLDDLATVAQNRIDTLGKFATAPKLYAAADLPKKPGPAGMNSPNGMQQMMKVRMGEGGKMEVVPDDSGAPAPVQLESTTPGSDATTPAPATPTSPTPVAPPSSEPKPGATPSKP